MNDIKKKRYDILGPKVAEALEARGFEAYYFETAAQAREKALEMITPDASVGYGGSVTINALGLKETLRQRGNTMFDRDLAANPAEKKAIEHASFNADWFLMGSNAISEDGQLINIDGIGNRVASLIFGPANVIIIAGMNKVVDNVDAAIDRARNTAAPINTIRLNRKTPCTQTGRCMDCMSPECICSQFVVTRRSMPAGRIKIILVGEELGY